MRSHVRTLAFLQLAHGGVLMLISIATVVFFGALSSYVASHERGGADELVPTAPMIAAVGQMFAAIAGVLSIPRIIAGWGLWRLRPWAKTLGLVIATLGLVDFPVGTATGGYTYWVLSHADTRALFEGGREPPPLPLDYLYPDENPPE